MNDVKKRLKNDFDAVTMPDSLKTSTLALIEKQSECPKVCTKNETHRKNTFKLASLAACLLACVLLIGSFGVYNAYATETAQVNLGSDAELVLGVNRFDKVVRIDCSEDASNLFEDNLCQSLKGLSFEEALDVLYEAGVLTSLQNENMVVMELQCTNEEQKTQLQQQYGTCMQKHFGNSETEHSQRMGNGGKGHKMNHGN